MNGYDYFSLAGTGLFIVIWLRADQKVRKVQRFATYRRLNAAVVVATVIGVALSYVFVLPYWLRVAPAVGMVVVLFGSSWLYRLSKWMDARGPSSDIRRR